MRCFFYVILYVRLTNEWYAKDTSKKVRAVFRNKGMSGQRLGGIVPYGYTKGDDGHLLIDEETAPVVKLIFQLCVEGNGTGKIARMLREREIPTPGTVNFQRTGRTSRYHPDEPCLWRISRSNRFNRFNSFYSTGGNYTFCQSHCYCSEGWSSLTERGKSLIPILDAMCDWGHANRVS